MTGHGPQLAMTDQERSSSSLPKSPPNNDKEERRKVGEDNKKEDRRRQQEEGRGELFSRKLKNNSVDIGFQDITSKETYRGCGEARQAGRSRRTSSSSCEASSLSTLSPESPGPSICSVEFARRSPSASRRTPSLANDRRHNVC